MQSHLNFSTEQVVTILLIELFIVLIVILLMRLSFRRASTANHSTRDDASPKSLIKGRTKYPDLETSQYRPMLMLLGIACALALTTTLMNWTTADIVKDDSVSPVEFEMEIEVNIPQTADPPPPPPPPPTVIEVPDEIIDDMEESIEFIDQSIEAETMVDIVETPAKKTESEYTPPPPPPKVKDDVEEIFRVVEDMPRFPGCEDLAAIAAEKRICAEKALFRFINDNLHYPAVARESNIQGNVVVQFVVNTDGSVQDVVILRDIGAGCGDEVVRVVNLMNQRNLRWIPGKQRGTPVRVMFVLPVKFSLLAN